MKGGRATLAVNKDEKGHGRGKDSFSERKGRRDRFSSLRGKDPGESIYQRFIWGAGSNVRSRERKIARVFDDQKDADIGNRGDVEVPRSFVAREPKKRGKTRFFKGRGKKEESWIRNKDVKMENMMPLLASADMKASFLTSHQARGEKTHGVILCGEKKGRKVQGTRFHAQLVDKTSLREHLNLLDFVGMQKSG